MSTPSPLPGARAIRPEIRWRHRFALLTVGATVGLIAWGGFVTSINAGLAVPDWPSSFNSYDPFNPWPAWWTLTPVLAEHGHRLMGALVGMLTVVLAVWSWRADDRAWMRRLGLAALGLVIVQGLLGGLRVVWVSLDLAVVHACTAQLYFAAAVALAVFTSPSWLRGDGRAAPAGLRRLATGAVLAVYGQIILGALLRHPGTGIHPLLAGLHMAGAFGVTAILSGLVWQARAASELGAPPRRAALGVATLLAAQILLGLTAYLVLLDERGLVQPSNVQVIVNTGHLVVGALLFGATVALRLRLGGGPRPQAASAPAPARAESLVSA